MITFTVYIDGNNNYIGYESDGHADFDAHGRDIVCAGVSTAVFGGYYFLKYGTQIGVETNITQGNLKLMVNSPDPAATLAIKMVLQQVEMVKSTPEGSDKIQIRMIRID